MCIHFTLHLRMCNTISGFKRMSKNKVDELKLKDDLEQHDYYDNKLPVNKLTRKSVFLMTIIVNFD